LEGLFAVGQRIFRDLGMPPPACLIDPIPSVGKVGKRQALKNAGMLGTALREDGHMVGNDLTGADFMLWFPLYLAHLRCWFEDVPGIFAYVERIAALPAFQAALAHTHAYMQNMRTSTPEFPSFGSTEALIPAVSQRTKGTGSATWKRQASR
jgi:glutathione S-transferase